jgi:prepilin-type N-terminal cleavage/methylation domain-containing protein
MVCMRKGKQGAQLSLGNASGFTLLEMSIVIAIAAALLGGLLTARSMVAAAKIRSITTDINRFRQAIGDFRDKYGALPGDFAGATALWGSADGVTPSDAACISTTATGTLTCDGNGDGIIGGLAAGAGDYESYRAWQHLANANMVEGNYTGQSVSGGTLISSPGTNVPASQLDGGGFTLMYNAINNGPTSHTIWFGAQSITLVGGVYTFGYTNDPIISGTDAELIDTKFDDGLPLTGKIQGYGTTLCTVAAIPNTLYDMTTSNAGCALDFVLDFQ